MKRPVVAIAMVLGAACLSRGQELALHHWAMVDESGFLAEQTEQAVRRLPPVPPLPPAEPAASSKADVQTSSLDPAPRDASAKPKPLDFSGGLSLDDEGELPLKVPKRPRPPSRLWRGSIELGFNGSEGNSQTLDFRFGLDARRRTPQNVLTLEADYHKRVADTEETANRLFFEGRYEWLFKQSRWTWYVHTTTESDAFKAYDARLTGDAGLGYRLVDTDVTRFIGRLGAGASHEVGGPEHDVVPELVYGLDYEHLLPHHQKIMAAIDYIPEMIYFNDFRLQSRASWEAVLDDQMNLSLRLSVLDRYDSTPHGKRPNDLDYSATLLWSF